MTQLTVRDAADRVGVTRQTIFKAIKQGKLSATVDARGQKQIDITELLRVYGRLQPPDDTPRDKRDGGQLSSQTTTTGVLQLELERAKMQLQVKDLELATMRERVEELKTREQEAKARERTVSEEKQQLLTIIDRQTLLLAAPKPARAARAAAKPKTPAKAPAPAPLVKRATPRAAAKKVVAKPTARPKAKPAAARKTPAKPVKKATRR